MKAFLILGAVVLVLIALVISWWRRRSESFAGTVVDKDVRETVQQSMNNQPGRSGIMIGGNRNAGVTHEYMIKVQTDAGKTIHWKVSQGKYELVKIGDRVSKSAGTTEIEIAPGTASVAAPVAVPPPTAPIQPSPLPVVPPTSTPPTPPPAPTPTVSPVQPPPPPTNTITN